MNNSQWIVKDPKKLHLFYFMLGFVAVCKCTAGQLCGSKTPVFINRRSKVCLHSRMKITISPLWYSPIKEFLVLPWVFLFYLTTFFLELFGVLVCLFCEFGVWFVWVGGFGLVWFFSPSGLFVFWVGFFAVCLFLKQSKDAVVIVWNQYFHLRVVRCDN